jgi:hypothetical protein
MLSSAVNLLVSQGHVVRRCSESEAAEVVARARANFAKDNRLSWWWEAFSKPVRQMGVEDGKPYFLQYVRPDAECWLIIDDGFARFPVVETSAAVAEMLLGELPYIEFYLVGKDLDWLLAENHHGAIWLL